MGKTREENVLEAKIVIMNALQKEFNIPFNELSDILKKYNIFWYIDLCYEAFNSMGIKGILLDIKNFIEEQGGSI